MRRKTQLAALAVAGALLLSGCTAATEENPAPSAAPTGTVQQVQTATFTLAYDPKQTMHPNPRTPAPHPAPRMSAI